MIKHLGYVDVGDTVDVPIDEYVVQMYTKINGVVYG